jgi:rhamnulokinase
MTHTWEHRIFDALEIPFRIGADIIRAGDVIGKLAPHIAGDVGLAEIKVIAPAVHDTASAAVAVPTEQESGWAFLSSGTWSIVGLELDAPIINDQSYAMNISNSGGACHKNLYLKNVMGLWILQCCKRIWNQRDPSLDYSEIVERAAQAPPFYAYIDPDHAMFLTPSNAPEQVAAFCRETGQRVVDPQEIGVISRVVLESLALKYRAVLERLMEATGQDVEVLHIIGGGSKNELLNQFTANALGKCVTTGPVEATAIGNILIQAIGAGVYSSLPEIRRVITTSFPVEQYTPEQNDQWNSEYGRFREILNKP